MSSFPPFPLISVRKPDIIYAAGWSRLGPGWSKQGAKKSVMISRSGPSGPGGPSIFEITHMCAHARARVKFHVFMFSSNLFYRKLLGPLGPVNKINNLPWTKPGPFVDHLDHVKILNTYDMDLRTRGD